MSEDTLLIYYVGIKLLFCLFSIIWELTTEIGITLNFGPQYLEAWGQM